MRKIVFIGLLILVVISMGCLSNGVSHSLKELAIDNPEILLPKSIEGFKTISLTPTERKEIKDTISNLTILIYPPKSPFTQEEKDEIHNTINSRTLVAIAKNTFSTGCGFKKGEVFLITDLAALEASPRTLVIKTDDCNVRFRNKDVDQFDIKENPEYIESLITLEERYGFKVAEMQEMIKTESQPPSIEPNPFYNESIKKLEQKYSVNKEILTIASDYRVNTVYVPIEIPEISYVKVNVEFIPESVIRSEIRRDLRETFSRKVIDSTTIYWANGKSVNIDWLADEFFFQIEVRGDAEPKIIRETGFTVAEAIIKHYSV